MPVSAPDLTAETEIQASETRGADVSAKLDRREQELVITNLGPGAAQLHQILLPDSPKDVFLDLRGIDGGQSINLLPGEEHSITAFAPGLELPLKVEMQWHDRLGEQRRVQLIMDASESHRGAGDDGGPTRDVEIARRHFDRDQRDLRYLFERHSGSVYAAALAATQDRQAAGEITRRVFAELWRDRDRLASKPSSYGTVRAWLRAAATDQARERARNA